MRPNPTKDHPAGWAIGLLFVSIVLAVSAAFLLSADFGLI
jgi:hypothetical protein